MYPAGHRPSKPHGYDDLARAPMPDRIADLERVLRARLASSAKSPPAVVARTVGWLFSDWHPDPALGGDVCLSTARTVTDHAEPQTGTPRTVIKVTSREIFEDAIRA
jgi:hypothetical protein